MDIEIMMYINGGNGGGNNGGSTPSSAPVRRIRESNTRKDMKQNKKTINEPQLRAIVKEAVSNVLKANQTLKKARIAFEKWCMDLNLEYTHKGDYVEDEEQCMGTGKQLMAAKYVIHFFADDYDIDEIREAISAVGEIDCGFEFSYLPRIRKIRNNEYSFIIDIH